MNTAIQLELARVAFTTVVLLAFLPIATFAAESVTEETECLGKFKGRKPSKEQLQNVLKLHDKWIEPLPKSNFRNKDLRANLCEANLMGANLMGANLMGANLMGANLSGANLMGANLSGANLRQAILTDAIVMGTNLREANLSEANLSRVDLRRARMLAANLRKADLSGAQLMRVNLTGANLSDANLRGANLSQSKMQEAILRKADLSETTMNDADLSKADLVGANLSGASLIMTGLYESNLHKADLSRTNMRNANLTKANLTHANLSDARLTRTYLKDAILTQVDLTGTYLVWADLESARISLKKGTELPNYLDWYLVENTSDLKIEGAETISAFVRLREDLRKNGMRKEERAVNTALRRASAKLLIDRTQKRRREETTYKEYLEYGFLYIAFDFTAEYGNSPGRPLLLLLCLTIGFAFPYAIFLQRKTPSPRSTIWRIWHEDRLPAYMPSDHRISGAKQSQSGNKKLERLTGLSILSTLGYCIYFSVLSAMHIGWRDLNVGTWIARMQPREYTLRATGWVRVFSGVQSLLSVYLLALSVLTYFGRPFQ